MKKPKLNQNESISEILIPVKMKKPKPINEFFKSLSLFQEHYYPIPQWVHVLRTLPIIADRHGLSIDQLIEMLEPWISACEITAPKTGEEGEEDDRPK